MTQPSGSSQPSPASAAPTEKRADLVLEGGGVKGIGLAGAVITLSDAGWTFPRVAGTSAGAICAALVAAIQQAGKPMSELNRILQTVDYPSFMRGDWAERHLKLVGEAGHLAFHMGIYDGDYLVEWLGGALEDLGVTTFGQLHTDDPGSSLPESCQYSLVVHTADISRNKLVRLPWDYPEYGMTVDSTRIVDAVRASMSIPFFFNPVRFEAPAHRSATDNYAAGKVTWVDGGLLSNFPVEVFDRSDGLPSRWPTIGIKLSAAKPSNPVETKDPGNALAEAISCVRTAMDNAGRYYIPPDKAKRTIFVDSFGLAATDFHLTAADQQRLYESGAKAATGYAA